MTRAPTHTLAAPGLVLLTLAPAQFNAEQTVRWLDNHGIPYWDPCFMADKGAVDAALYVEDGPKNIEELRRAGKDVIVFTNSTNRGLSVPPCDRADSWEIAEQLIRAGTTCGAKRRI